MVTLKASFRAALASPDQAMVRAREIDVDRLRDARGAAGKIERPALLAQHRGVDAERRDQVHGAAHGKAHDQDRPQDAPMPTLAHLKFAQKDFLRPVEVGLLVHFGAAFAGRHGQGANVDAVGLGALQQGDMLEAG
ncbi:hypothetical protein ACVWWP_001425 [Bradyrhizobium sp. LM3.6]